MPSTFVCCPREALAHRDPVAVPGQRATGCTSASRRIPTCAPANGQSAQLAGLDRALADVRLTTGLHAQRDQTPTGGDSQGGKGREWSTWSLSPRAPTTSRPHRSVEVCAAGRLRPAPRSSVRDGRPTISRPMSRAWRRFVANRKAVVHAVLVLVLLAVAGLATHSPDRQRRPARDWRARRSSARRETTTPRPSESHAFAEDGSAGQRGEFNDEEKAQRETELLAEDAERPRKSIRAGSTLIPHLAAHPPHAVFAAVEDEEDRAGAVEWLLAGAEIDELVLVAVLGG